MSTFSRFLPENQLCTGAWLLTLNQEGVGKKQLSSWAMLREAGLLLVGSPGPILTWGIHLALLPPSLGLLIYVMKIVVGLDGLQCSFQS